MKLIQKITKNYLINSIIILLVFSVVLFFLIYSLIQEESDDSLKSSRDYVIENIKNGKISDFYPYIHIERIDSTFILPIRVFYSDTNLEMKKNKEKIDFRQIVSYNNIGGNNYKIIIRTSLIEKDELFLTLLIASLSVSLLLVITLFVYNRKTINSIFRPFYKNLNILKKFNIRSDKKLILEEVHISEFTELNQILAELTERASNEYGSLKKFSENASHELQTPLAVINSKIEILLQKENIDIETTNQIHSILKETNRLSKLNKALILLVNISNKNLYTTTELEVSHILENKVNDFVEIAKEKNIIIRNNIKNKYIISANETLFNILLNNLFSNALKHNINDGFIDIKIINDELIISNSGKELKTDPEKLFDRFVKDNSSFESIGLGLSIVKEICSLYNFKVNYMYMDRIHEIRISLS